VFSVGGAFVIAREEKAHVEVPSYPEVHGERLETMVSTATFTHYKFFDAFDMTAYPWPE
jgi:hypothetical protein